MVAPVHPAPRALLLSGSLGMGHDVMAEAMASSLVRRGWTTETLDCMALLGGGAGIGDRVFRTVLSMAPVYDAFHFSVLRQGGRIPRLADAGALWQLMPRLREQLARDPATLVVGVFATGAAAASRLKSENPNLTTAVFCTDVTAHAMWVHPGIDLYLVTSEVGKASVLRHQPRAAVAVVPAPVRAGFYAPTPRAQARAAHGVPADAPCVLLMTGAWGLGPVAEAAAALADAGVHVLAVAGRNPRLEARLRAAAATRPTLHPFGFSTEIPALMSAADLVVTASGDTCSEARVVGRDLLLLDVVPGHGRDNLQHELELGRARVSGGAPEAVVACVLAQLPGVTVDPAPTRGPQAWEAAFSTALDRLGLAAAG